MFSGWICHELKAGFHARLFCLCLSANVSFHFTSYCFFLEQRPFSYTEFQQSWPCLGLNMSCFVSDQDHLVQWWVNFKIWYLFRKSFGGHGCILCSLFTRLLFFVHFWNAYNMVHVCRLRFMDQVNWQIKLPGYGIQFLEVQRWVFRSSAERGNL